ncbi:MAG TPA: hypothetical protein DCS82_10065, partial [Rhodospirillaceae bacterium]|nr:hypothetical protein [Rhodospirillaceae bacterium]
MTRLPAKYNDGETAAQHAVEIVWTPVGVRIEDPNRTMLAEWAWAEIGLAEAVSDDRPVRLLNRSVEGARLTVDDHSILSHLEQNSPHLKRNPVSFRDKRRFAIIGTVLAAFVVFVVYGLPQFAGPLAKSIPMAW